MRLPLGRENELGTQHGQYTGVDSEKISTTEASASSSTGQESGKVRRDTSTLIKGKNQNKDFWGPGSGGRDSGTKRGR